MKKDLPIGRRFSRLTVLEKSDRVCATGSMWLCICECGTQITASRCNLVSGHTRSCGCLQRELTSIRSRRHGFSCRANGRSSTYRAWESMRRRCNNKHDSRYADYGGRGISVDKQWETFETFLKDMGERPPRHSLDRIDNDAGYSIANCRWATHEQQSNNKRTNKVVSYGAMTMTLRDWCRFLDMPYQTIWKRMKRGMSFASAVGVVLHPDRAGVLAAVA